MLEYQKSNEASRMMGHQPTQIITVQQPSSRSMDAV